MARSVGLKKTMFYQHPWISSSSFGLYIFFALCACIGNGLSETDLALSSLKNWFAWKCLTNLLHSLVRQYLTRRHHPRLI